LINTRERERKREREREREREKGEGTCPREHGGYRQTSPPWWLDSEERKCGIPGGIFLDRTARYSHDD
jgi:hypothetical protein